MLAIIGGKAISDTKIIYKKYGVKASQHVTLKITKEGLVDIHLTEGGREKKSMLCNLLSYEAGMPISGKTIG